VHSREFEVVVSYLEQHARIDDLPKPIHALGGLLLNNFGWPLTTAKQRVKAIIQDLEAEKIVQCSYDGRRALRSIRFIPPEPKSRTEEPRTEPKRSVADASESRLPNLSGERSPTVGRRRKAFEASQRNETRGYNLVTSLLSFLGKQFPQFTKLEASKSGHHNPRKGKFDLADHNGEDIGIVLAADLGDASSLAGRVMLDVKSSPRSAERFNNDIRFGEYEIKTKALLKRAWPVNPTISDRDAAAMVLDCIIEAGFTFVAPFREELLEQFSVLAA
jgi:hypothetical protein